MPLQWQLDSGHSGCLIRLQRLLEKLRGFHALIVQHNRPLYRDGLIDFLAASSTDQITLDLKQCNDFAEFEQCFVALSENVSVVHIINLESLSEQKRQEFFRGINYHREFLARSFAGVVMFWCIEVHIREMALKAADFWAWREQVFDFSSSVDTVPHQIEPWHQVLNLDSAVKQERIEEIESFLRSEADKLTLSRTDLKQELGRLYWSVGEYKKAEQAFQLAIDDYHQLDEREAEAVTQRDLCEVWYRIGRGDQALEVLQKRVLPVFKMLRNQMEIAETFDVVADILVSQGELDQALVIRKTEQLPVYEQLGDVRSLLVGRTNLALLLWQMDSVKNRDQVQELLCLALGEAGRLQLPEAEQIAGFLMQMGLTCES